MIKQIIAEHNITTHTELQRYLAKLSDSRHYWDYDIEMRDGLKRAGMLDKCVIVELDGISKYYENEII